ncbi:Dnaj chaperone-like protein [Leishmania tarentolae]|uniref:Dnaj chaperone-like protein n=1 Tax=Leishmania tarentolae TaxID=5689 RepID=A0A640KQN9_LEITA|nr:Dnaj chaperone-like protein [Leishmania tarentolae]
MVDLYAVLEVDKSATPEQIKRNYHRLALRYHPDKAGPEGAAHFKEVSTAYEVLSDLKKKEIYDRYGEAGLDALENPVAGAALATFGSTAPVVITLGIFFTCAVMVLLFLVFLVSFVDGNLRTWNYVKVFAPLFVLDVVVGVPVLILLVVFVIMSPLSLQVHCTLLSLLCAVVLTIVIPIAKDRNEAVARDGRTDYLQWRLWLIPGYLLSVFAFMAIVLTSLPTERRILQLKSMGLVRLANYARFGFVLTILQGCCIAMFFALVACRADEVITSNYFVVVGLPIFLLLTLLFVNRLVLNLLSSYISDAPPEVAAAAEAREVNENGGEATAPHPNEDSSEGPHSSWRSSPNPMCGGAAEGPNRANRREGAEAERQLHSTEVHAHGNGDGEGDGSDGQAYQRASQGKNPYAGQHASACGICINMLITGIIVGLLMASTAMIAVRLNHYSAYGDYKGVLSLSKACIPLFIIIGSVVLMELIACLIFCCCSVFMVAQGAAPEPEHGNQQEGKAGNEADTQYNTRTDPAQPADQGLSGGPSQNEASRHCQHGDASTMLPVVTSPGDLGKTPGERQPDSARLSDVD